MMSLASLSAAASAAIPASSTALLVAVTCAVRPPPTTPTSLMGPNVPDPTLTQPLLNLAATYFRVTRLTGSCAGSALFLLVEPAFRDVLDDTVRHQIPDRLSSHDTLPAVGRGDRQGGDLHQADPFAGQPVSGQPVPGPGAADEMSELEQLVRILPGHHPGQGVRAGDEEQFRAVAAYRAKLAQRIDGVRGARPVDVHPADRKPRVRRGRDHRHQVTVLRRRDAAVVLLPRLAGRHEHHLIQREEVRDLTRRHQVAMVDRVERAAHHPDPLGGRSAISAHTVTLAINPSRAAAGCPHATAPPVPPCRPPCAAPCPRAAPGRRPARRAPRGAWTPELPRKAAHRPKVSGQEDPFGIRNRPAAWARLPSHPAPAGSRGAGPGRRGAPAPPRWGIC